LSSVGELAYACSDEPKFYPLDPFEIGQNHVDFPISTMQPHYFVAESFQKAKAQITNYCESMPNPFQVTFNKETLSIEVDRKIKTRSEIL
jgi:phenylalanine-4-hydroxylase